MLKTRKEIRDDVLFTLDCTFVSVAPVRTVRTLKNTQRELCFL